MTQIKYTEKLKEKQYALAVIDDDGDINTDLAFNACIPEVTDIEYWFNFGKLPAGYKLVRFTRENGHVWSQELDEHGRADWRKLFS